MQITHAGCSSTLGRGAAAGGAALPPNPAGLGGTGGGGPLSLTDISMTAAASISSAHFSMASAAMAAVTFGASISCSCEMRWTT